MTDLGKIMIGAGVLIALVGAVVWIVGKSGFRGLPGDVAYEGKNVQIYFPIVSCIVLSVLLTLGMWLWRWLSKK